MDVILVHPEIPHNTGCIARLSAATGIRLHLVEPLGFSLADRYLKRAGLDYWPMVDVVVHADWESATRTLARDSARPLPERIRLFSARGGSTLFETRFAPDDLLVFGRESTGLPEALLEEYSDRHVYIPIRDGVRSLNLASTVCLATYTAMVSAGVPLPDNDGTYRPHPKCDEKVQPIEVIRPAEGG
jgi:tRNA (cytidine/uridine-2'-O-)-methyltransferase